MIPLIITDNRRSLPPHPDLLEITSVDTLKINQVRQIKNFLSLKPYSTTKTVVIKQADKMTIPAQNALLKILEEPPAASQIILETTRPEALLPTILSRCQIVRLKIKNLKFKIEESKIPNRVGERLKIAGEYGKNKQMATEFLNKLILSEREKLLQGNLPAAKNLRLCLNSATYLTANCNPSLVLGNLLIKYRSF